MSEAPPNPHLHHLAMAEQGKTLALQGRHGPALERYRAALLMARQMSAPAVFARHYTDCIFESLERSGQLAPALELCEAACGEMAGVDDPTPIQIRDRASMLLRRGALLLRLDRGPEAENSLEEAVQLSGPGHLPLAEELLSWRRRALSISGERLTEAQERHGYFVVRRDTLRRDLLDRSSPSSLASDPGRTGGAGTTSF
ncbi:MAG: peptidylprolyl isomerase [Gemmatimonadales bacterium]|nr:MAG: peptidylprolyl isomerase [Gemmatimonadales bacterium]